MARLAPLAAGLLAAGSFCSTLSAADQVRVELPSIKRMVERFQNSVYGDIYNSDGLAMVRMGLEGELAGPQMGVMMATGVDPLEYLTTGGLIALRVQHTSDDDSEIKATIQAQLPGAGEGLIKAAEEAGDEAKPLAELPDGASHGWEIDDDITGKLLIMGEHIVMAMNGAETTVVTEPAGGDVDYFLGWDGPALTTSFAAIADNNGEAEDFQQFMDISGGIPSGSYAFKIVPSGSEEVLYVEKSGDWMGTVDSAVTSRLPAGAVMAGAVSINMGAWYKANGEAMLKIAAEEEGMTVAELKAEAEAALAEEGLNFTIEQMMDGFSGTMALAVTPGAPIPGVSIILPRSPVIDQLLAKAATEAELELPAENESKMVPLPGSPLPAHIARDGAYWLISSDAGYARNWLNGEGGGWDASPAGSEALQAAGNNSFLVGASDTLLLLDMMEAYLPFAEQAGPEGQMVGQITRQMLPVIRKKAASGFIVGRPAQNGTMLRVRGLLPSFSLIGGLGFFGYSTQVGSSEVFPPDMAIPEEEIDPIPAE